MWPIQRGTAVVAKLFADIDIAEGSHYLENTLELKDCE